MNVQIKLVAALAFAGALSACGESTESDIQALDGHYLGTLTTGGFSLDLDGVVSDEGQVLLYSRAGDLFYAGLLLAGADGGVDGVMRTYNHEAGADTNYAIYGSASSGPIVFEGDAVSREDIVGRLVSGGSASRMNLSYDTTESGLSSSLASLAGTYEGRDGQLFWRMQLTESGALTGVDDAGCQFSGNLGPSSGSNTYAVSKLQVDCGNGETYQFDGATYKTASGLGLSLYDSGTAIIAELPRLN